VVLTGEGAGCEHQGEKLAQKELSDEDVEQIKADHRGAVMTGKESDYYFRIFRQHHPQDSVLNSIGIWTGFDFAGERRKVGGTMEG
jgi:asparagine synthase (glutamine-hydrolysing)